MSNRHIEVEPKKNIKCICISDGKITKEILSKFSDIEFDVKHIHGNLIVLQDDYGTWICDYSEILNSTREFDKLKILK